MRVENEHGINKHELAALKVRRQLKEKEYTATHLPYEICTARLRGMLKATRTSQYETDQYSVIERLQQEKKQLTCSLKQLQSQIDTIDKRLRYAHERKQILVCMRQQNDKNHDDIQLALSKKTIDESQFKKFETYRNILRHVYQSRTANDLPQKIFHSLPINRTYTGGNISGEYCVDFPQICSTTLMTHVFD
jgi:hypothetical protein